MKHAKKIILIAAIILVSVAIGVYGGINYYKRQMQASAIGFWATGVDALEKKEYDYAILYLSQAIGQWNENADFFGALAEAYERKQNRAMALVSCQPCNVGKSVVYFLHNQHRRIGYEEIHRDTCRRRTRSSW